ncbi:hypothetical protein JOS77_03045 [Chromobacterium haemolyticum]|nr:hypothetical protein JOS77_03045 [Chromobacterium haemolyticum]
MFAQQMLKRAGAGKEEQRHQHQRRPFEHRQQHGLVFYHGVGSGAAAPGRASLKP